MRIQYAIDGDTGLIWSRMGDEIVFPVLTYDQMSLQNSFTAPMVLEKCNVLDITRRVWRGLKWTQKISDDIKNKHRQFWGLKCL